MPDITVTIGQHQLRFGAITVEQTEGYHVAARRHREVSAMRASRGSERGGAARQYPAAHHDSPVITPSDMTPIIGNCACFPGKYDSGRHGHIKASEIVWSCRATNAALAHQTSAGNPPPIRASASGRTPPGQTVVDKLNQFAAAARSLLHREDTVRTLSTPGIADYTGADSSQR